MVSDLGCKPSSAASCLADLGKVICLRDHKSKRLGSGLRCLMLAGVTSYKTKYIYLYSFSCTAWERVQDL